MSGMLLLFLFSWPTSFTSQSCMNGWKAFTLACWWLELRGSCAHKKPSWVAQWYFCTTLHLLSQMNCLFSRKLEKLLWQVTRTVSEPFNGFPRQNPLFSCLIFLGVIIPCESPIQVIIRLSLWYLRHLLFHHLVAPSIRKVCSMVCKWCLSLSITSWV